jgi:molecular chaperone Hsp33
MSDILLRAQTGDTRVDVAACITTQVVQAAAAAHELAGTSAIALGRLLTGTGLVGLTSGLPGVTSVQILSKSRLQQIFADVTEEGWLRGYVKNAALTYPLLLNEDPLGRRTLGPAVHPGQVSVVRMGENGTYVQSATPLRDGEVDTDLDHFLNQSDQVASVLRADTLVDHAGQVMRAGGVIVRALPDSDVDELHALKARIEAGAVSDALREGATARELLERVAPGARETDPPRHPVWRCRCSKAKVLSTIGMLDVMEIASMVAEDRPVEVRCELCNTLHRAEKGELEALMKQKTSAQS